MLSLLWGIWLVFSAIAIIVICIGLLIKGAIGLLFILAYIYDFVLRIFGKKPKNGFA